MCTLPDYPCSRTGLPQAAQSEQSYFDALRREMLRPQTADLRLRSQGARHVDICAPPKILKPSRHPMQIKPKRADVQQAQLQTYAYAHRDAHARVDDNWLSLSSKRTLANNEQYRSMLPSVVNVLILPSNDSEPSISSRRACSFSS